MKPVIALVTIFTAGALLAGCASTRQSSASAIPPRLQVAVDVSPLMASFRWDEEIAEAFAYRVSASLHEQGFRGRIAYLDRWETPNPSVPLLEVTLREWRVDRSGIVDCTFDATLQGTGRSVPLGMFHGSSFMLWPRRDWYARAEGFEEAARDAVGNLAAKIEQTGLLEPVRTR